MCSGNSDDINAYLRSLKIHNIDRDVLRKKISNIQSIPLFMNGRFQCYIRDSCQIEGFDIAARMQDANAWFSKANNLFDALKFSIDYAILLNDKCNALFTPFRITDEYKGVFYYVENALYRLFALWDVLGQLYNHFFQMGIKVRDVDYFKLFKEPNLVNLNKKFMQLHYSYNIKNSIKKEFINIARYIRQEYTYEQEITKGHHQYLKSIRNRSIHRENPHDFTIVNASKYGQQLPDAPLYEINSLVEDSFAVYDYMCTIFKLFYFEFKSQGFNVGKLKIVSFTK